MYTYTDSYTYTYSIEYTQRTDTASHDSQAQSEAASTVGVYTSPHHLHHASPYHLPPLTLTPPCNNARQGGAGGQACNGADHRGGLASNQPGGCRLALFQGLFARARCLYLVLSVFLLRPVLSVS